MINDLISLRKTLHQNPEISGKEVQTAKIIKDFISSRGFGTAEIIKNVGGNGLLVVFESANEGPVIVFRADMDALPIEEINNFDHKSRNKGISHKCGHDGHMAILSGLALKLKEYPIEKGKVILLFQPAEETGKGAKLVCNDEKFRFYEPNYVFAIHNLPGFDKNQIIIKTGPFTSASIGMIIQLNGKTSHAAYPEKGNNPAIVISEIIQNLYEIAKNTYWFKSGVLITPVYIQLGDTGFGISPGNAEIRFTLRAESDEDLNLLTTYCKNEIISRCKEHKINYTLSFEDKFKAIDNSKKAVEFIKKTAKKNKHSIKVITEAFRWSEDFSVFTSYYHGALLGLGAGKNHPGLHQADYDFPDDIIETGINMFYGICEEILNLLI